MRSKCLGVGVVLVWLSAAPLVAQEPSSAQAPWQPARLSDGQPDVQGVWGAVLRGVFSLTNPMTGGDDFAQRLGGPPIRRPSRIVDPADGKVPYQPWAAALQERQSKAWEHATQPWEIDTQSRCLLSIAPRLSMLPTPFRIIQTPGLVVFVWEDYHAYRVVSLDGRPHLGVGRQIVDGRRARALGGQHPRHRDHESEREGAAQRRRRFPQRARARDRAPDLHRRQHDDL